jgi:hypothetical protein
VSDGLTIGLCLLRFMYHQQNWTEWKIVPDRNSPDYYRLLFFSLLLILITTLEKLRKKFRQYEIPIRFLLISFQYMIQFEVSNNCMFVFLSHETSHTYRLNFSDFLFFNWLGIETKVYHPKESFKLTLSLEKKIFFFVYTICWSR